MKYLFDGQRGSIFVSNGYSEQPITSYAGTVIDLSKLSAWLRILLVTDGTVTKTLEAMFWEPIQIELVKQDYLSGPGGEELLERDVTLIGVNTGTQYAYARSYLNTNLMPDNLVAALKSGERGIGWLLRQMSTEQYRDIVEIGYSNTLAKRDVPAGYESAIFRTYCINVGGRRLMQISEHFPVDLYL
ncbi:chorismate--pyruvate lyase family protein [Halioxenophilus aromaticivorans]|uniref:Chorismate pyruvate-lyase family protein n=1 Tax=Halioxenophilus aromaticivorans TaxID=1306992 RepID=A0AAV3U7Q8_9ALTE